jgi:hypothetical protein
MSRENLFDDITRVLASPMPRRQAFRLIAGGLAGGSLGFLLAPEQALAVGAACGSGCPKNGVTCNNNMTCDKSNCFAITLPGDPFNGKCRCCAVVCGGHCCCGEETCCFNTVCCPQGMPCCNQESGIGCCPAGTVCRNRRCCKNPCPGNTTGRISAIRSGPPAQADATIQNAVEGISTISVATAVNCTVANMPMNAGGTKSPMVCTATKIDQTKPAQFVFNVCPPNTPVECCCPVDPIFTVLKLTTGQWVRQTFADVPPAEHFVTMTNGDPGLTRLHIWVNSKHYTTLNLRDNETRGLDLAAAMTEKENTISLVGAGELGASASVAIVDSPPAPVTSHGAASAAAQAQGPTSRHNATWGPLAEETEENSHLHAAKSASQTVQVNFNGALSNAANPSAFTVEVNGKAAAVQAAHVQAGAAGMDLTLQLPPGTLHNGDSVDVSWDNLRDAKGRPLAGHVPLFAQ